MTWTWFSRGRNGITTNVVGLLTCSPYVLRHKMSNPIVDQARAAARLGTPVFVDRKTGQVTIGSDMPVGSISNDEAAELDTFIDELFQRAIYISLHTADPGEAGTDEVSYGGYKRVAVARSQNDWHLANDGEISNRQPIHFPQCTSGEQVVTHFGIWERGRILFSGTLTSGVRVTPLTTLHFPSGAMNISHELMRDALGIKLVWGDVGQ